MEQVWVAETWGPHGDESTVQGVYGSREAAQDGLKGEVDVLYVDDDGNLCGRPSRVPESPRDARHWSPKWASAYPMPVLGRAQPPEDASAPRGDRHDAR
jgi:hypothetical protein